MVLTNRNKVRKTDTVDGFEFIADVGSSSTAGTFTTLLNLPMNPGDSRLFKRAVAISDLYEQWRFKRLTFFYEPSTDFTKSGVVGMYVDHDADDASAASMAAVMAHTDAAMGPIYKPLSLRVSTGGTSNWYYTHQGYVNTASANDRLQTPGDFRFFCDKVDASKSLGYVYVDYEIEFRYPKDPQSLVLTADLIDSTGVTVASADYYTPFVDLSGTNNRVNRGFTWEDEAVTNDENPSSGSVTYWPCTSGLANYSIVLFGSVTVTNGSAYSVSLYGVPPGANTPTAYFGWSLTGTGSAQDLFALHVSGFATTVPSGTRLYLAFVNASGGNITLTTSAVRFHLAASLESQVSLPARMSGWTEEKSVDPSGIGFTLPEQSSLLNNFLETCGPCSVSVTVNGPPRVRFEQEVEMLESRIRSLRKALPHPSFLPSPPEPVRMNRVEVPLPRGDEALSSRPPSAFSVVSRR